VVNADAEIDAMGKILTILEPLDDQARTRVLKWVNGRFGDPAFQAEPPVRAVIKPDLHFSDLFDAVEPRTELQRALVAGYWLQAVGGAEDFDAQAANAALKNLGYGISNITSALTRAQREKPALVRQIMKAGRSQQARKRYRLTTTGVKYVQGLVGRNGGAHSAKPDMHEGGGSM